MKDAAFDGLPESSRQAIRVPDILNTRNPTTANCNYPNTNPTFLKNRKLKSETFQIPKRNPKIFRSIIEEELDVSNQNIKLKTDF